MPIPLKTSAEIELMRQGGTILAKILSELKNCVEPGIKTKELDKIAEKLFLKYQVKSSFKNYNNYPASICASVNEEVVHSIPGERILQKGDIIKLDCGVLYQGFHTDSAITVCLEPVSPAVKKFVALVEKTLYQIIDFIKPGIKIGTISSFIEQSALKNGYSPVHELTGHGVGKKLHEEPQIPNYGIKNSGYALKPGMTIAIEPIINFGKRYIKTLADKWTIVTLDNSFSAQFEHTIAIVDHGAEILTQ